MEKINYVDKENIYDNDVIRNVQGIILINGPRCSGKTTTVNKIIGNIYDKIDLFMYFSQTTDGTQDFVTQMTRYNKTMNKDFNIYTHLDCSVLESIIQTQRNALLQENEINILNNLCIIIDDFHFDREFVHSAVFKDLFINSKFYNILTLITLQYQNDLPKDLRSIADIIIICK